MAQSFQSELYPLFEELSLDRRLQLGLDALGFSEPTQVQEKAIVSALSGRDLLISSETGSGKTLAYLVPLLQKILICDLQASGGTLGLVLAPTRELVRQILTVTRALLAHSPVRAQAITGGADFKYQKSMLRKDPEIVIATPGRLLEHCNKGTAHLNALQTLVLDEADRMLDLGFRDDVLRIVQSSPTERQTLLLSATLSHGGVRAIAGNVLNDPQSIALGDVRQAHRNILHQRILADDQEHKDLLLLALTAGEDSSRVLVFANKRATATRLAALGSSNARRFEALHGDMSTEARKSVVQRFRDGRIDVLCASDVAARGLDIAGIDTVINYDVPHNGQDYQHRAGRTGRADSPGLAISLVSHLEWNRMISIARYLDMPLENRSVPGMKARYSGPKKQKNSGKAAGPKKKRNKKAQAKTQAGERKKQNPGQPRKRTVKTKENDGFAPLTRKKNRD